MQHRDCSRERRAKGMAEMILVVLCRIVLAMPFAIAACAASYRLSITAGDGIADVDDDSMPFPVAIAGHSPICA